MKTCFPGRPQMTLLSNPLLPRPRGGWVSVISKDGGGRTKCPPNPAPGTTPAPQKIPAARLLL